MHTIYNVLSPWGVSFHFSIPSPVWEGNHWLQILGHMPRKYVSSFFLIVSNYIVFNAYAAKQNISSEKNVELPWIWCIEALTHQLLRSTCKGPRATALPEQPPGNSNEIQLKRESCCFTAECLIDQGLSNFFAIHTKKYSVTQYSYTYVCAHIHNWSKTLPPQYLLLL